MRIFISYGDPDVGYATALRSALQLLGYDVKIFSPAEFPGEKLHHFMRDQISDADAMILICSEASLLRPGVSNEIEEALQKEARTGGETVLIPITIDDFVFERWRPRHPGTAQAVRSRVIGDFRGVSPRSREFQTRVSQLRDQLQRAYPDSHQERAIRVSQVVYSVDLVDLSGALARLRYHQRFTALKDGPAVLDIPNITGSGTIRFIGCDFADLIDVEDEGGKQRILLAPRHSLIAAKRYALSAEFDAINCFDEGPFTASVTPTEAVDRIEIHVTFPDKRPPSTASCVRASGAGRSPVPGVRRRLGGRELRVRIENPTVAATYVLKWDWPSPR